MHSPQLSKAPLFPGNSFAEKAPFIVQSLQNDLQLTIAQAAGILGNIGHETGGLTMMQEIRPVAGRGGYGWVQWTGPRRVAFEAWCAAADLDISSDEANYGYLVHELKTSESNALSKLLATTTLAAAVTAFEQYFERAGVVSMSERLKYGQIAFDAC